MNHAKTIARLLLAVAVLEAGVGCERAPSTQAAATQPAAAEPPQAEDREAVGAFLNDSLPPDAAGLPAGHPPLSAGNRSRKVLLYETPAAWKPRPPTSSMRKAQFVLPGTEGGSHDAELIVYYFGPGEGGPVASNIARWRGMFVTDAGEPVGDDAVKQESIEVNGLTVTLLDVSGNYRASVMPGAAPAEPQKDAQRLLAAVIETPDGPWFLKGVGPAETMTAHHEHFMAFVRSIKY